MTERSPLRRFQGPKEEFRGLNVAVISYLHVSITFLYLKGNFIGDKHPISTARGKTGLKRGFKGAQKEFRWSKVVSLGTIIIPWQTLNFFVLVIVDHHHQECIFSVERGFTL